MEFNSAQRKDKEKLESKIQKEIKENLEGHGFYVKVISGGKFQSGLPDLYAHRSDIGSVWIEVKRPKHKKELSGGLSSEQIAEFKKMRSYGVKVFVFTDVSDYHKLFEPCNFESYLNGHRGPRPIGFEAPNHDQVYGFQKTVRRKNSKRNPTKGNNKG